MGGLGSCCCWFGMFGALEVGMGPCWAEDVTAEVVVVAMGGATEFETLLLFCTCCCCCCCCCCFC